MAADTDVLEQDTRQLDDAEVPRELTPENLLAFVLHAHAPDDIESLKVPDIAYDTMKDDVRDFLRHIRSGSATEDEQQAWEEIKAAMTQRYQAEHPNQTLSSSKLEDLFYEDATRLRYQVAKYRLLGEQPKMGESKPAEPEKADTLQVTEGELPSDEELSVLATMLLAKNNTEIHAGSQSVTIRLSEAVVNACKAIQKEFISKHSKDRPSDRYMTREKRRAEATQALAALFGNEAGADLASQLGNDAQTIIGEISRLSQEVPVDILQFLPLPIEAHTVRGKDLTVHHTTKEYYPDQLEIKPYRFKSADENLEVAA